MHSYDTLTEALADLRQRGYVLDYNLVGAVARCPQVGEELGPEQLLIEEVYRFEGNSDPDDNVVLYALQSRQNPSHRGVLVAAYGSDVDPDTAEFIRRLDGHAARH